MARVQLALNVTDLDAAVEFYQAMFATPPAKRMPGYANFAISDPPLKLVLIESASCSGAKGALNHLGVELESVDAVGEATTRFEDVGLATTSREVGTCCFALQDKVWVQGPDATSWEFYTVLADAPASSGLAGDGACCASAAVGGSDEAVVSSTAACC